MALSVSSLEGKIKSEIEAVFGPADDTVMLQKFAHAVAKAVYDEITANAEVQPGTFQVNGGGNWPIVGVGTVT